MPKGVHSWLCFDQTNTFRADIWSARDQFTQVSFSCPLRFFYFFYTLSKPPFLPSCPELLKRPKQKNSCSKLWFIDQLYEELGCYLKCSFLHLLTVSESESEIILFFVVSFDFKQQCNLDLVTLLASAKTVPKLHNVTKLNNYV